MNGVAGSDDRVVLFSDIRGRDGFAKSFLPLSTLAIGTALYEHGVSVSVVDAQVDTDWRNTLAEALPGCLFFGVSALTGPSLNAVLDAVTLARSQAPQVPVVWGGYHATHNYESLFAEGLADYVVRGVGEIAVVELVDALKSPVRGEREKVLAEIAGLAYLREGTLVCNQQAKLTGMHVIPEINYGLVDVEEYLAANGRVLHAITSYGCPHACTFCVEPTQSLRRWKGMDPQKTVNQFARLHKTYSPQVISLHDPNFSSSPSRVAEIVAIMKERRLAIPMICDMRAKDVIHLSGLMDVRDLASVGVTAVFLGLESGSNHVLKLLRKGSTAEDGLQASKILDYAGIETLTSFMHDIPGESEQDSAETFRLLEQLAQLPFNRQRHHFFTPYPATPMFDQLARERKLDANWSQRQWAMTGTYWGSVIWPGRPEFRAQVLPKLLDLMGRFPHALDESGLPQLEVRT